MPVWPHPKGIYWLPLDADDKIAPCFLEKCVPVLEDRTDIGFVYTDMMHFGAISGPWRLPEFNADTIVHKNNIGCVCSLSQKAGLGGHGRLQRTDETGVRGLGLLDQLH